MNKNIYLQIAKDLNITHFSKENESQFIGRIIYSAISEWIKASTFDRKIDDHEGVKEEGCTKHHITRKCGEILEGFLEIYPHIEFYFYPFEEKDPKPVQEIQKRLLLGGVLVPGENNTVQLSKEKNGFVNNNLYFERGYFYEPGKQVFGLGCYRNSQKENIPCVRLEELFYIPNENAEKTVNYYINEFKSNFINISDIPDYWRFFDYSSKKSFHNSWNEYFDKNREITVYKNNINNSDYGFIKYSGGKFFFTPFPKHIIQTKEVRRILYGIRSIENNPCNSELTIQGKEVKIQLYTSLPLREQSLLYMISWPVNNMYDRTQYITSIKFLPVIQRILSNLNVDFKVIT
ncbi:hypothetical protein F1737_04600 [Methanoplanus sp. FWC-SCC4]|uniref:Uncharacterized protein n=1 Tax=Methanochimaera problematica TaxID=2609417 RepID=A0AA97I412_9EURY|nr:hypothetical protein [Methanoplanus sp. FWC-SCC4]WOF16034.1 hypothetical protein F1737_04600 [Methanoplanus sp. FWC-SCC4]